MSDIILFTAKEARILSTDFNIHRDEIDTILGNRKDKQEFNSISRYIETLAKEGQTEAWIERKLTDRTLEMLKNRGFTIKDLRLKSGTKHTDIHINYIIRW